MEKGIQTDEPSVKSNKVWICWFQGEKNAPELVKACTNSIRMNLSDREIVFLTDDNISDYIQLPEYIIAKRKKGIIGAAHYSDLIRIELLCKYGGLWVDATVLCTSHDMFEEISDLRLFVYKQMDLIRSDKTPTVASNWLIYAHSNQKILLLTRNLLHLYWKTENKVNDYFIFHIFFALSAKRYQDEWDDIPMFNNHSPHTLQFELDRKYDANRWKQICRISDFHKLNHHNDYSKTQNSYYKFLIQKFIN